jgi:hypothetical protein
MKNNTRGDHLLVFQPFLNQKLCMQERRSRQGERKRRKREKKKNSLATLLITLVNLGRFRLT